MQALEDLYLGEIRPGEQMGKRSQQYKKALDPERQIIADGCLINYYRNHCYGWGIVSASYKKAPRRKLRGVILLHYVIGFNSRAASCSFATSIKACT